MTNQRKQKPIRKFDPHNSEVVLVHESQWDQMPAKMRLDLLKGEPIVIFRWDGDVELFFGWKPTKEDEDGYRKLMDQAIKNTRQNPDRFACVTGPRH